MSESVLSLDQSRSTSKPENPVDLLFEGSGSDGDSSPDQEQSTKVEVDPTIVYNPPAGSSQGAASHHGARQADPDKNQEPIFKIRPMDPRSNQPPIDSRAQQNECVYIRNKEARFQIDIKWPPATDACWISVEAPEDFGVSFRHQDKKCDYDGNKFKLGDWVSNASFTISLTCPERDIQHHVLFKNGDDIVENINVERP